MVYFKELEGLKPGDLFLDLLENKKLLKPQFKSTPDRNFQEIYKTLEKKRKNYDADIDTPLPSSQPRPKEDSDDEGEEGYSGVEEESSDEEKYQGDMSSESESDDDNDEEANDGFVTGGCADAGDTSDSSESEDDETQPKPTKKRHILKSKKEAVQPAPKEEMSSEKILFNYELMRHLYDDKDMPPMSEFMEPGDKKRVFDEQKMRLDIKRTVTIERQKITSCAAAMQFIASNILGFDGLQGFTKLQIERMDLYNPYIMELATKKSIFNLDKLPAELKIAFTMMAQMVILYFLNKIMSGNGDRVLSMLGDVGKLDGKLLSSIFGVKTDEDAGTTQSSPDHHQEEKETKGFEGPDISVEDVDALGKDDDD